MVNEQGDRERAQVVMARRLMVEVLGMSELDVANCGPLRVCATDGESLLVKFTSIDHVRTINRFKKNLPRGFNVSDFVPPCLED